MNVLREEAIKATKEILEEANLSKGDIFVVGCSTSEVVGGRIGKHSSVEAAKEIFKGIMSVLEPEGIFLAAQCCEHLNRAIVIEHRAIDKNYPIVNAIPMEHAGGSFAKTAYEEFANPVLVEEIQGDAGIDIGDTLIGMHLKQVAVPLRIESKKIGEAHILGARTRPKFIGGQRAVYDENLIK